MAKVTITRDTDGSGDWLAEGEIGESAYYANAATLGELQALIREAGELVGVDPKVVVVAEAATA
ncbi:MAG: hypothetical protein OXE93_09740 [bacterium]|nr:hypothetical protein [bacterium]MCY4164474.1 hypothetical protein [bacterium]MCY4257989.1 hypothetical protein [bacterium]